MPNDKYTTLASEVTIAKTKENLVANGFQVEVVESGADALNYIKMNIPKGVSLMNGSSRTLEQIGFVQLLKDGEHDWNNLHDAVLAETDPEKQNQLRQQAMHSDYFVNSVASLSETGELLISSNSGSQMPHLVATSSNIILVVGAQKIVPTIKDAFDRLETHVIPLEDERLMGVYGFHTTHAKSLILHKENPMMGRKITVVIVAKESLGF